MRVGRTIALCGATGSGKTTQAGEYALYIRKTRSRPSVLFTSDRGGCDSLAPHIRSGFLRRVDLEPDADPWVWINAAASGDNISEDYNDGGLAIFDSGSSIGDALLTACHKSDLQIGQQKTQRFSVSRGKAGAPNLNVSINNEAHY